MRTSEAGWLFLDSVDEARLNSPTCFEKAIRNIAKRTSRAFQRTHIFITSRVSSWRFETDYRLYQRSVPYDLSDKDEKNKYTEISVYKLSDLSDEQVKAFAASRGIGDAEIFLREVKNKGIRGLVARPADLLDVIGYWIENESISCRKDHFEHNLKRRLNEWKQGYKETNPINYDSLIGGSKKWL